jgi:hypothetical protein
MSSQFRAVPRSPVRTSHYMNLINISISSHTFSTARDPETLRVCLICVQLSTVSISIWLSFLQWHPASFPRELGGGSYADCSGPLENMLPASKGWICVVGTGDCIVLGNHLHRLSKGGLLGCRVFWWFGEFCESAQWEYINEYTALKCSSTAAHGHAYAVFTSVVCVGEWNVFLPWNVRSYLTVYFQ